jgi:hypothetical protein
MLLEVRVGERDAVLVESRSEDIPADLMLEEVSTGGPAARSALSFESVLQILGPLLALLASSLQVGATDEMTAQLGIRFGGSRGLILVPPADGVLQITVKKGASQPG